MIIEDQPASLEAVAAYIDLNPVRAGMVEDPKDYRFCGYASALAGNALARQGLLSCKLGVDWDACAAAYRMRLFVRGGSIRKSDEPAAWSALPPGKEPHSALTPGIISPPDEQFARHAGTDLKG